MVDRKLTGNFLHLYINPQKKMPDEARKIHGLTDAFLADKPEFAEVADQIEEFLKGTPYWAHNAAFDRGFINSELARAKRPGLEEFGAVMNDTMAMGQEILGKRMSMDQLVKQFKIPNSRKANAGLHGAMVDATLLGRVYLPLTSQQGSFIAPAEEIQTSVERVIDLSSFNLPVIMANEAEAEADREYHEAMAKSMRPRG